MTHELKPCPFCGADKPAFHCDNGRGVVLRCQACQASGGSAGNEPYAREAWNRRATTPPSHEAALVQTQVVATMIDERCVVVEVRDIGPTGESEGEWRWDTTVCGGEPGWPRKRAVEIAEELEARGVVKARIREMPL